MDLDLGGKWDSIKDGTKEVAELAHEKTSVFHEAYVSKVLPDCGKYGDAAKFVAEMAPGVSEYNAIVDGDWTGFAIAAGIDIGAYVIGKATGGEGYLAVKGGSAVAKVGAKVAVKEVAEAGAKKVVKEVVEEGIEKVAKETIETGAKKVIKEAVEEGVEKTGKEIIETVVKLDNVEKKAIQIAKNKLEGTLKEEIVQKKLIEEFGEENVIREALIRGADGIPIEDIVTGSRRRIDFIVKKGDEVIKSIEVTSETASKKLQIEKELRILEQAREAGGAFIKDTATGKLIPFAENIATEIWRL